jgi:hypothetical protein
MIENRPQTSSNMLSVPERFRQRTGSRRLFPLHKAGLPCEIRLVDVCIETKVLIVTE